MRESLELARIISELEREADRLENDAEIREREIERARRVWRKLVDARFRELLDAQSESSD